MEALPPSLTSLHPLASAVSSPGMMPPHQGFTILPVLESWTQIPFIKEASQFPDRGKWLLPLALTGFGLTAPAMLCVAEACFHTCHPGSHSERSHLPQPLALRVGSRGDATKGKTPAVHAIPFAHVFSPTPVLASPS